MNSRMRTVSTLVCGLILLTTSLAPAPDDTPKVKRAALVARRLELSKKIFEAELRRFKSGEATFPTVALASSRMIEAHRQAGSPKADLVQAARDHLALMQRIELIEKSKFDARAVSVTDLQRAQDAVLEAEIWLIDAESM